jgi:tRNA pseudouridine38-40 synthase
MARSDWRRPTEFSLSPGYRRIKLLVTYDGAQFAGWQRQKVDRTVQQEIETALAKIIGVRIHVQGSGRTDSGVHALGQVAHFDTPNQSIPADIFSLALNKLLPQDVRILSSSEVSDTFHARFTAIRREYRYYCKEYHDYSPFDRNRVYRLRKFPPLDLLNGYAQTLVGTHDFRTFGAVADQSHSKVRDLYTSDFHLEQSRWGGQLLVYTVSGNAFLMHQVRSMVGTMIELGERGDPVEEFVRRLASKDRRQAGKTAPPDGLYLYRIDYDEPT